MVLCVLGCSKGTSQRFVIVIVEPADTGRSWYVLKARRKHSFGLCMLMLELSGSFLYSSLPLDSHIIVSNNHIYTGKSKTYQMEKVIGGM